MAKKLLLVIAITTIVFTVGWTGARPLPAQYGWERADLKVLKVFSAHDGEAAFQAYLVKWKDQEVIVSDTLVRTDYHAGDSIPALVMKSKYPNGKPGPDLLAFQVVPH